MTLWLPALCIVMILRNVYGLAKFRYHHCAAFLAFWVALLTYHYTDADALMLVLIGALIVGVVTRRKRAG